MDFYKLRVPKDTRQLFVTVSPAAGTVWLFVTSDPSVKIDTEDESTYEVRTLLVIELRGISEDGYIIFGLLRARELRNVEEISRSHYQAHGSLSTISASRHEKLKRNYAHISRVSEEEKNRCDVFLCFTRHWQTLN